MTVRLGAPERVAKYEWVCPVQIVAKRSTSIDVHGLDAFQALMLAMSVIRDRLDDLAPVKWEGGEKGDAGFPLYVPEYMGRRVALRLEKKLLTEIRREGAIINRKLKRHLATKAMRDVMRRLKERGTDGNPPPPRRRA